MLRPATPDSSRMKFHRSSKGCEGTKGLTDSISCTCFVPAQFVAKPDGRNRTPLHELEKQEVLTAWKQTERATEQAIGLIRSELGLVNMDILWSGAFLFRLLLCAPTQQPRQRDSKGLVGWLGLAALLHRYSGSSETRLDEDLKACREADRIGALMKNLRQRRPTLVAQPADFSGALADRSGLLVLSHCLVCTVESGFLYGSQSASAK